MITGRIQKWVRLGLVPVVAVCLFFVQPPAESRQQVETYGNGTVGERTVNLFFPDRKGTFLRSETRTVRAEESSAELAIGIVNGLIEGPREDLLPVFPKQTKLLALYITEDGTAVVDFNSAVKESRFWEVNAERMAIYSVVNSLVLNTDTITAVRFLIEGREPITLGGHWDVRHPITANMLLNR